ncbi:hypothetical protein [Kitasatospora sp. NPDC058046]|uniref:hypothetical protein n=1 Tax=Kitasatospora sp. NPDC058046 TaxID=3346312 RepID=UPI0036DF7966
MSDIDDLLAEMAADDAADAAADLAVTEAAAAVVEEAVQATPAAPAVEPDDFPLAPPAPAVDEAAAAAAFDAAVGDAFGGTPVPAEPDEDCLMLSTDPAEDFAQAGRAVPPPPTAPPTIPAQASPAVPPPPTTPPTVPGPVYTQKYDLPPGHVPGGGRLPRAGQTVDLTAQPAAPEPAPADEQPADEGEQPAAEAQQADDVFPWWSLMWARVTAKDGQAARAAHTAYTEAQAAYAKAQAQAAAEHAAAQGEEQAAAPAEQTYGSGSWKPADKRQRWMLFNSGAAAIGYGFNISPWFEGFMPAAQAGVVGTIGLAFDLAGGWVTWKVLGHRAVQAVLPHPFIARIVGTISLGEVCRRLAPAGAAWLDQHGSSWGLGPSVASLWITAVVVNGGIYYLIDHRVRHRTALVRFICRVPLATAAVATLLYAPGPTL